MRNTVLASEDLKKKIIAWLHEMVLSRGHVQNTSIFMFTLLHMVIVRSMTAFKFRDWLNQYLQSPSVNMLSGIPTHIWEWTAHCYIQALGCFHKCYQQGFSTQMATNVMMSVYIVNCTWRSCTHWKRSTRLHWCVPMGFPHGIMTSKRE